MNNPYNPWDPYGRKAFANELLQRTRARNAEFLKNTDARLEEERQFRSGLGPSGSVSGVDQRSGDGLFRLFFWSAVGGGLFGLFC